MASYPQWSPTMSYTKYELVYHNGAVWESLIYANLGNEPGTDIISWKYKMEYSPGEGNGLPNTFQGWKNLINRLITVIKEMNLDAAVLVNWINETVENSLLRDILVGIVVSVFPGTSTEGREPTDEERKKLEEAINRSTALEAQLKQTYIIVGVVVVIFIILLIVLMKKPAKKKSHKRKK